MFLDNLVDNSSLIISYYYSVNLTILMNYASILHKKRNKNICIANYGKIKWEFYPYEIDFPIRCDENSAMLVFEAESEKEIPEKFSLATSYKNLRINAIKIQIEKIDNNLYKAISKGNIISVFKINEGKITEQQMDNIYAEILYIIKDLGGTCDLRDLLNISSKKLEIPKEEIKERLLFLKEINKIEIEKNKTIRLIQ
ncbi:hypothetical protein DFR86_08530 [Acidianus sulfidivorans JP7]|uniref:Uncharacterized protein n=1 Tax=Acidianus sulfidivorans JP7 TaxID=619593 RepID=A0A2U9INE0_9CREN|nr:hypothetical protein [Acidianus sulfidivorans]AWR97589.1 hypothetical protein DFR86_08530 [Acidianus sulfidivorans JP7]